MFAPTRKFTDPFLEGEFQAEYRASGLRFARIAVLVGAALACAFYLTLATEPLGDRPLGYRQLVRLATAAILLLSAFVVSVCPKWAARNYHVAVGIPVLTGFAALGAIALLQPEAEYARSGRLVASAVLAIWLAHVFSRLRSSVLLCASAISSLTIVWASIRAADAYLPIVILYLGLASLIGWITANQLEHRERELFRQANALKDALLAFQQKAEEAREANDAKSRVLRAVSHDMAQPLASLSLYVGLLSSASDLGSAEREKLLGAMRECIRAMESNAARLLDIVRLRQVQGLLETECVPVPRLVQSVYDIYCPLAIEKGVVLRLRLASHTVLAAMTNERRLLDALSNIVGNAIKFAAVIAGERKPWVLIAASAVGNRIRIDVVDNGVGIAAEHHSKIFDEYYRVQDDRSLVGGGYGLGLTMVNEIIQRLPEHRLVLSSRRDRGARFRIYLPHADGTTMSPPRDLFTSASADHLAT